MCGNILWEASGSKAFLYSSSSVALPSCLADGLFILGILYLNLGVLRHVLGVRYAVSVLVTSLLFLVSFATLASSSSREKEVRLM